MKHILVVDDDKTNLTAAKNALGDFYKVTAVLSGMQALRFLYNNTCDLILLDINMPEMDGFEVVRRIRENESLSKIPVIFLTANQQRESVMEGIKLGINDYITKPFVFGELRKRVGRFFQTAGVPKTNEEMLGFFSELLNDLQDDQIKTAISKLESMIKLIKDENAD